jgi:hypothetical protein
MQYTYCLIVCFSAVLMGCGTTHAVVHKPPIEVSIVCTGNPACEFKGDKIPIVVSIKNNQENDIGVPVEYLQQTGPTIELTDALSQRSTNLKINLGQHALRKKFTAVAPGQSVVVRWYIAPFELRQFGHGAVDVTAKVSIHTFIAMPSSNAPVDVTASSSVRIVSSATKAHTPSAARAPSEFGHTKVGATTLAALGAFERPLLPLTGFTLITGGIVTRSTVYIFDFNAASLTMLRAAVAGRAVDLAQDQKQTIALSEAAQAEIVRLANAIWMSKNSYTNSPPESASFDVRLILVDSTAAKDIVSYGRPKFEAKQLFDLLLELTP